MFPLASLAHQVFLAGALASVFATSDTSQTISDMKISPSQDTSPGGGWSVSNRRENEFVTAECSGKPGFSQTWREPDGRRGRVGTGAL